ncbi:MAG: ATP-binding protein [Kiritimatiellia bacterium]
MIHPKQLQIRPYARLLTMLGEQLIKNERIALIELIKNSYDADADWVKVTFQGFGENYKIEADSKIIIEDNGHGMNREIIENHWLNPATPEKKGGRK